VVRALKLVKKTSRAAFLRPETRARLARSGRVFLLGIVIACGIEVIVDASATLSDIAVLRDRVHERGTSYAAVLTRALVEPLKARDAALCERVAAGVFDDPEVVFVRATTADGEVVYERIPEPDQAAFRKTHGGADFQSFYKHQLDRDARGVVSDPSGLRSRLEGSRHKDFAQEWSDLLASIGKKLGGGAKRAPGSGAIVLFQDRLYVEDATRARDGSVTYAVGRVDDTDANAAGAVIVAFDMTPTNSAIRGKYLKGAGMVLFFVGLIIVQNVLGRREKLRLLDLETRELAAREAIKGALPADLDDGPVRVVGAVSPTTRVIDGVVWDRWAEGEAATVALYDPQGVGIDAAAVSLHVLAMSRAERAVGKRTLAETLAAAGRAANEVPLARALGAMLLRAGDGRAEGIFGPMGDARIVRGGEVLRFDVEPIPDVPAHIVGPLRKVSSAILPGDVIAVVSDGLIGAGKLDVDTVVADIESRRKGTGRTPRPNDLFVSTRHRAPSLLANDIAIVLITIA
jgi:hypothetical protein